MYILFVEVVQGTGPLQRRPEIENLFDAPFLPQVINTAHIAEGLIGWRRKPQFLRKQFVRLGYLEGVHARRGKIEIVATVILPVHISRLRTQREIAELISGYERRAMTFLIVVGWASRIAVVGDRKSTRLNSSH